MDNEEQRMDLLKWILQWCASSWRNLVVLLMLSTIILMSYGIYANWSEIRPALMRKIFSPVIDKTAFDEAAQRLYTATGTATVSISLVNAASDAKDIGYFTVQGVHDRSIEGKADTLFSASSDHRNNQIIKLIRGERFCETFVPESDPVAAPAYNKIGIKYVCSISVPSGYSPDFLGIITVGFPDKVQNESIVLYELALAADKLMK